MKAIVQDQAALTVSDRMKVLAATGLSVNLSPELVVEISRRPGRIDCLKRQLSVRDQLCGAMLRRQLRLRAALRRAWWYCGISFACGALAGWML